MLIKCGLIGILLIFHTYTSVLQLRIIWVNTESLLTLTKAPQLSWDVMIDAEFLCESYLALVIAISNTLWLRWGLR
jgi:hypothetical protein